MKYEIPEVLLQNIFNYLSKQPYIEVFELIGALEKQAKPILPVAQDVLPEKQALKDVL